MPHVDSLRQAGQEAIVGLNLQFQIIFFSPAAETLFGYRAAEVLGQPFELLVPDRLHNSLRNRLQAFVAKPLPLGQALGHYEIAGKCKSGQEIPLEAVVSVVEPTSGQRQYLAFFKDLSERQQTGHELVKLSRAVEQSPTAVIITNVQGNIEYVNSKFTALTGYTLAEVLGQNPRLLKSGETSLDQYEHLWATILAGGEWHGTFHNKKKNGELYWESALISPVMDTDGHLTHFIAHKEDITERVIAERALREERDLVAAILDTSSALIVVLNADGRVVRFNRTAETISGYSSAEIVGQNFWEQLAPPDEADHIRGWFPVLYVDQLPPQAEHHWVTKTGRRRLISWSFSALMNGSSRPKYLIATGLDITERRRAEEDLRISIADNRALLNAIPDLMFRVNREGVYLDYKSSEYVDLFVPPSQFLGKRAQDVLPGELGRQVMHSIEQALGPERGRSQTFEYQLPIKGELNQYEARITASGPDEVLMLVRDITQRKRVEEAEHEQRVLAQALRDAAAALNSSLNLDEILDRILDNVGHVVPHDAVNIMLIENGLAHVARARGYAERGLHDWLMSANMSIQDLYGVDVLVNTLTPLLVADTRAETGWFELPQTRWIRSYLGVPIQVNDQVVGILNLDSATPGFFTAAHGERLKVFADQAATAIKNAQLVSETRRQAERERLINQITNRIRGSMDIDAIIKTTVVELGRILGASRCMIRLGADVNYMPIAHEFDQPGIEPLGAEASRVSPGVRERLIARQTVALDDTRHTSPALYQEGICAVLSTPIMVRNTLLGALSFHECLRPRRWQRDEVELIETIAAQVGVAIENARLYHETRRQLGELSILHTAAIATADSTSHSEALLKVAHSVRDALGNVKVNTFLIDSDTEELVVRASAGFSATELANIKIRIGQGVTGWVAQTGQPALVPDVKTDPRYICIDPLVRSELCVPLRSGSRIVGVLNVESHELDAFAERDLQLLTTLSHNLTVIIDNIRLLEEVRAANERLKELDRLKSQFLANMSHELRTPLNAIIGFSELLGDGVAGPLNGDQSEYIAHINTSGRHLLSLITDILDLSKIQAGRMTLERQDVSIATLIAEAQTFIMPAVARKHQNFVLRVPPDLPTVNVDPLRIKQVLINLLSNACKYTPDEGAIALRVDLIDQDLLLVSVSDTGRGIPPEAQSSIFEEFRQVTDTLDREEGTGLGLAIAQRLIDMHGGKIWVESSGQPGLGSTFFFTLPVQPEKPSGAAARSGAPVALIVEDDHDFSELLALHLRQAGYRTRQCYYASEAVGLAHELKPQLLTLDIVLPDGDGWAILRELKAAPELRAVGILIISSMEQDQAEVAAGRIEYLPKPLLKNQLMQAINRLEHRQPDRPLRILVVDDDPMLIELLQAILPQPAFQATAAINGAHAIEQIMREPPDLLILDLMMPDMNGFELLAALRSDPRTRDLPVIVLTAKTLEGLEQAELAQSAQSVILKTDLRRDRLLAEIHRLRQTVHPRSIT